MRSHHEVVGIRDRLLFRGDGEAVYRQEADECALVCRQACTDVALDDPHDLFREPPLPAVSGTDLRMGQSVGAAPPDIVEHRAGSKDFPVHDALYEKTESQVADGIAVPDNSAAAPRLLKEIAPPLAPVRHSRATL